MSPKKIILSVVLFFCLLIGAIFIFRFFQNRADLDRLDSQRIIDLRTIADGLQKYFSNHGRYPLAESGACLELSPSSLFSEIVPTYLDKIPSDPKSPQFCYFYQTRDNGEIYKLAARMEADQNSAQNDGGTLKNYFEIFNEKGTQQVQPSLGGVLYAWGDNSHREIEGDETSYFDSPRLFNQLFDVTQVSAGESFGLALTARGELYAWGNNQYGQLGDGTNIPSEEIIKVAGLRDIRKIAAGRNFSLALAATGQVYSWGNNQYGQLGDGSKIAKFSPIIISSLPKIQDIAIGKDHALAVGEDGTVYSWGYNGRGQLGDGTLVTERVIPARVVGADDVEQASAGIAHSLAVTKNGQVYAWGFNEYGQLGDGTVRSSIVPILIKNLSKIKQVSAGDYHSLVLTDNGQVYAWGFNAFGQLGDGTKFDQHAPILVSGLDNMSAITAGGNHSLARASWGSAYAWGYNFFGQLGDGTVTDQNIPVEVGAKKFFFFKDSLIDVVQVSAGENFSLAIVAE